MFAKLAKYGKQYAPIYKLIGGTYFLVLVSLPEDVEILISGMQNIEKSSIYLNLHIWLETGLLTSTDKKWQNRRKLLTPTFHFNILQQFSKVLIETSEKMLKEIAPVTNQAINVVPLLTKYTLLMICETAMGVDLDLAHMAEYRLAILEMGKIILHRVQRPWFYSGIIGRILYFLSPTCYRGILTSRFLRKYSNNIIKKRQATFKADNIILPDNSASESGYKSKRRFGMLDMLLYAKNTGNSIDDRGIREEVNTFIFEGHDTVSSCLGFTLMLLACNKDVQDRVMEEINYLIPNKNDNITFDILNNMKYLERVLKESLRLYPSVPMFGRRISETVTTYTGYTLPPGTDIMVRVFDMHRDPSIFSDPEKFDPDRFLPEKVKDRHPFAYLPFSAGPRNCIGIIHKYVQLRAWNSRQLVGIAVLSKHLLL
ncbi:cytochrome p450 family 4 [Holotrichia oblita]|uniref:Cytochrome p450 family 4 n=1 Tax=Holotrichia oblita TaxID=644536 RepID=A0ACB9T8A9_HOLOL|nr:cytochrome p450 family 4 [Holotrichia oblita]